MLVTCKYKDEQIHRGAVRTGRGNFEGRGDGMNKKNRTPTLKCVKTLDRGGRKGIEN